MSDEKRILYMEDNEGTARLLQKRLARSGYAVDIASNGEDGLALLEAGAYDAVLIDYNMPDLDGLQVMRRMARGDKPPAIIMLTGSGDERIAVEALKLGATDYVVKDVEGTYLELLPTVVEQGLRNQRLLEDKRRAEEALQRSEKYFRALIENSLDLIALTDSTGIIRYISPSIQPIFGLDETALIGRSGLDLITPQGLDLMDSDSIHEAVKFFRTLLDNPGKLVEVELRIRPRGGSTLWLEVRGKNLLHEPWIEAMVFNIRDITWRKQAQAQTQAHIEQLQVLHTIDGELSRRLDIDYVLTMALDNMMRLSRANAGSIEVVDDDNMLRGKAAGYPDAGDHSLEERSIVARVARQCQAEWVRDVAADLDYVEVLPDTVSQIVIPLLSQDRLIGIVNLETRQSDLFTGELFEFLQLIASRVAVAIDNARLHHTTQQQLAELQALYAQVSKLEQLKTDMIRIAAHDLRNPLTVVTSNVYLLRKKAWSHLTEEEQGYIASIDKAAQQMKSITTDFLSLDRIEDAALGDPQGQKTDLVGVVQSAFASLRSQSQDKHQIYLLHLPDVPVVVQGHETELQQAVTNLISNAIKYTPEGGKIEVALRQQDNVVHFEVIDNGYGIPVEQQETLFQPFFRAQTEETQSIEGTGLGLYLVKKIVERVGGKIVFQSEYGKGSTFGFRLRQYP